MADFQIDSIRSIYADGHLMFSSIDNKGERLQTYQTKALPTEHSRFYEQDNTLNGPSEFNLIYRKLFPTDKTEQFSLGYRFSYNPDHRYKDVTEQKYHPGFTSWDGSTYEETRIKQPSKGGLSEHTLQSDYTMRFNEANILRIGAKEILRLGASNPEYHRWDHSTASWQEDPNPLYSSGDMKLLQNIISAYTSYSWQRKNWGLNVGLRGEYALDKISFAKASAQDFSIPHFDLIPTDKISFTPSQTQQFSLFYSARTIRPAIWSLNPFRQQTNEFQAHVGNPHLKSEREHHAELNYTLFSNTFYMNLGLNYNHANNAIMRYNYKDTSNPKLTYSSYANIGLHQTPAFSFWANWRPINSLSLSTFGNLGYHSFSNKATSIERRSWIYSIGVWSDITLPNQWSLGGFFNYSSNPPTFQTSYSYNRHYQFFVKKSFWERKLDFTLTFDRIFDKYTHFVTHSWGEGFESTQVNDIIARSVGLKISYNFSSGKSKMLKRDRSIHNDDLKESTGVK